MNFRKGKLPRRFKLKNQISQYRVVRHDLCRFRRRWYVNPRQGKQIQRQQDFLSDQGRAIKHRLPEDNAGNDDEGSNEFSVYKFSLFIVHC